MKLQNVALIVMRSLPAVRALLLAMAAALPLNGCVKHAAPASRGVVLRGIVAPADLKPGENYRGLYAGGSADKGIWTALDATITLRKPRPATRLVIVGYVPDSSDRLKAWYQRHPLALAVTFGGGRPQRYCCLTGGLGSTHFSLPPNLRDVRGEVTFDLRVLGAVPLHDIDPAQTDRRALGVVLVRLFLY